MRSEKSIGLALFTILTVTVFLTAPHAIAQQGTVLHSFGGYSGDGFEPLDRLTFDASGNLYGTTNQGGANGEGVVFELMPQASGGWTEKVLHTFKNDGRDGRNPWAGLNFDAAGNLYGTTYRGGPYDSGTVFELSPSAIGGWTEKILYNFNYNSKGGSNPTAGVTFDASGNLYGTTSLGGDGSCNVVGYLSGCGVAFELLPQAGGSWTEKILHTFTNNTNDGKFPYVGLIFDPSGNLYGTTFQGGVYGFGMVFELTPTTAGKWTEKPLHDFGTNKDGQTPSYDALTLDASGNLYGATITGGLYGGGTVFELTPTTGGGWTEKILHNFSNNDNGGNGVYAGVIRDASGNLYGMTGIGGPYPKLCGEQGCGTVFELTPTPAGTWSEKVLYNFTSTSGYFSQASLILDASGNLYGTALLGGAYFGGNHSAAGTLFKITP